MDTSSAVLLAEAQQALMSARSQDALVRAMVTAVRRCVGFSGFEFGLVRAEAGRPADVEAWLSIDVAPGAVPCWRSAAPLFAPAVEAWLRARAPLLLQYPGSQVALPREHVAQCMRLGIANAVFTATLHWPAPRVFYCAVTRVRPDALRAAPALLELMAPACESAWRRVLHAAPPPKPDTHGLPDLSSIQQRVLHWIGCGKTNREIGRLEGLTEDGVKYHVKQIFEKINVTNRAQAAARLAELALAQRVPAAGGAHALSSARAAGARRDTPRTA